MFTNAFKIATLQGFDIKIDPSWVLIAVLITWSLSAHYFPAVLPDATPALYLQLAIIAMIGFFASLVLHEMSHSIVARWYGVEIKGITLFIFGGVAELGSEPKTALSEFWIAIVGPLMSLALSAGFWLLTQLGWALAPGMALNHVLHYLALINLVLAIFNMLPAFPLDGGRILRAYLWHKTGDMLAATATATRTSSYLAFALILFGVVDLVAGNAISAIWKVLIGTFVYTIAKSTYAHQLQKKAFEGKTVFNLMTRNVITVRPSLSLKELTEQVMLPQSKSFVPVVEDEVLLGHVDTAILSHIPRAEWASTRVDDVYVSPGHGNTVGPDLPASSVMQKISETGKRKFLVVEGHKLLGVITLTDLMSYMSVLQEISQTDAHR